MGSETAAATTDAGTRGAAGGSESIAAASMAAPGDRVVPTLVQKKSCLNIRQTYSRMITRMALVNSQEDASFIFTDFV